MKEVEVEIKFPLNNPKTVIKKLNSIAKRIKSDDCQKDVYFIPSHRNFIKQEPVSEWLRIREGKRGTVLNYKKWHSTGGVSCDEFETSVDNIVALKRIFQSLDFNQLITVEKTRSSWDYNDVEISIDKVTELGWFIELEAKNESSIGEAKELLYKALKELNADVGPQDFKGYPHLILDKKKLL